MAILLVSACAPITPTIAPEPADISFAFHEADLRYYEGLLGAFTDAYPMVSIKLIPINWDQMASISGETADVFAADTSFLHRLDEQSELLSLDPFLQGDAAVDLDDYYPGTISAVTREGRLWALPAGVDVYVVYLNQDLLTGYGAAYPDTDWSWPEFLDLALTMRDDVMRIYGYTTIPGHWDAVLFIYQNGGQIVDNARNPTRFVFDDPLAIEALEFYASLFHEYDVAPTLVEARTYFGGGAYAYYQGIRNGRVGMWVLPLSQRGGLMWPVEWLSDWRVAPLPSGSTSASTATVEAYAISAETAHREACWLWLAFLSDQMTYRLMPPRVSLAKSEEFDQVAGEEVAAVARLALESAVMVSPQLSTRLANEFQTFTKAVDQIIEGTMEPAEAMDWAARHAGS